MLPHASLPASFDWPGSRSIRHTHVPPGDPSSCAFRTGSPCPCHLFRGQPRISSLYADCREGDTHREPGVRYGSALTLRRRGGGRRHRDRCRYDNDHGSDLRGRQRSGIDHRKEQSRVWHAGCASRRRPCGAVRGASLKLRKGDTCGYGPPLGVRSY